MPDVYVRRVGDQCWLTEADDHLFHFRRWELDPGDDEHLIKQARDILEAPDLAFTGPYVRTPGSLDMRATLTA